jgi:hypothetical protein
MAALPRTLQPEFRRVKGLWPCCRGPWLIGLSGAYLSEIDDQLFAALFGCDFHVDAEMLAIIIGRRPDHDIVALD